MRKLERSIWKPDKLLRDRILERLGENIGNDEKLLAEPEYGRWLDRGHIHQAIKQRRWQDATERLERYQQTYNMKDPLEKQYYLSMFALVKSIDGTWNEEKLAQVYEEALDLTVRNFEDRALSEMALSVQELNLILEYVHYHKEKDEVKSNCRKNKEAIIRDAAD